MGKSFKINKCFLCGAKVASCGEDPKPGPGHKIVFQAWRDSCVHSVSSALNLSMDPSLGRVMSRLAKYCNTCTTLIRDVDFLVLTLSRVKKDLSTKAGVLEGVIRAHYENLDPRFLAKQPTPGSYEFELANLYNSLNESPRSKVDGEPMEHISLVEVKQEHEDDPSVSEPVKSRRKKSVKRLHADMIAPVESEIEVQSDEDYCPSELDNDTFDEGEAMESVDQSEADNEEIVSNEHCETGSIRGKRPSTSSIGKSKLKAKKLTCLEKGCRSSRKYFFKEKDLAIHHRKVHEGDPKPLHCELCPKKFSSRTAYHYHRRAHEGAVNSCPHCGRTFSSPNHLKVHGRRCTESLPLPPPGRRRGDSIYSQCTYENCDFFGYESAMTVHVRSVHLHEKNPYVCSICESEFRNSSAHRIHMRQHAAGSPRHKCSFCPQVFWVAGELQKHVKVRHFVQNNQNRNFSCPACTKLFDTESERDVHVVLHDTQEHPFTCVLCQLVFTSFIDLKTHVRRMHEEGVPQCSLCFKTLKTPKSLEKHVCGLRRPSLACKTCDFVGTNLNDLTKHRLAEHGGNFMCQVCGRLYIDKYSLKKHERLHTGDLHLKCSLCPKVFNTHSKVKCHEQTHWTEASYLCPTCGKGFRTERYLKQHSRSHMRQ